MAKIKFSKTELKKQRDDLKRFSRFLPTLQLKKQQLQGEVRKMNEQIEQHRERLDRFTAELGDWVGLFNVDEADVVKDQVEVEELVLDTRNIAGVDIPVLTDVTFAPLTHDLYRTSPWVDAGIKTMKEMIELEAEGRVLARQRELLEAELRTTTQRVNLFEKVKIPEAEENIRKIQIYLGDQQTAAVARAKIAKNKLVES